MGNRGNPRGGSTPLGPLRRLVFRYREWPSSPYRRNLAIAESKNLLRVSARFVALSCLILCGGSVLLMITPGGPETVPARIATSVVAIAALTAGLLWWFKGWPRERTSYLFIAAAEVGHAIVLFSCTAPVVSLLAATWFFLIGDYLAFAHGRSALFVHCVWVEANLLFYGIRAWVEPEADVSFVVFLVIAQTATLIVTRLFAQLFADAMRSDSERSAELAHRDPMTKLLNRRGLDAEAPRLFGLAAADDAAVIAVLLIDVDQFKTVNDVHGHLSGDDVLKLLAQRLERSVRKFGLVARTGGEEFVVLDRVHPDGIKPMAERLRRICQNPSDKIPISVSVGAVGIPAADFRSSDPHLLVANMIIRADGAMYSAKLRGGDQVAVDVPPSASAEGSAGDAAGELSQRAAQAIFDDVIARRLKTGDTTTRASDTGAVERADNQGRSPVGSEDGC
jgi:diguanylate cyclase (GGDEF)-like protein